MYIKKDLFSNHGSTAWVCIIQQIQVSCADPEIFPGEGGGGDYLSLPGGRGGGGRSDAYIL